MESSRKYRLYENLLYLILWVILFITPIAGFFFRSTNDVHFVFHWSDVFHICYEFIPFLVLFLIHNFIIAPLLIDKNKRVTYLVLVIALLACFATYQLTYGVQFKPDGPMPGMNEPRAMHEPGSHDRDVFSPMEMDRPQPQKGEPGLKPRPPILMDNISAIKIFIAILMLGMNLGVMLFFRGKKDEERMAELEKRNLKYQLQYLKYQVNPHFFMNTLNNIHALVDIDPEQAKRTIVELSKLMRYVLYEADKKLISLQREIDFINHYIALMRIRYTDKVKITTDMPQGVSNIEIPPLLFILFVENAFKHGVSYQKDSFIDISIKVENDRIHFRCLNSKHDSEVMEEAGGIGLTNARKCLELIYGNDFTFEIMNEPLTYEVNLELPTNINTLKV